ncbi:MAG: oligosaccharide flippase family protein [Chloroflexi bacterium]|nr:oligosaccharide flippase family protein [Chloroflexota bacterium]
MQLLKQFSALLFVRWLLLTCSFLVGILVARFLGPEGKGVLTVVVTAATLLSIVCSFGLPTAALYLYKQERNSIAQLVVAALMFWFVLVILATLLLLAFREPLTVLLLGDLQELELKPVWLGFMILLMPGFLVSSLLSVLLVIDGHNRTYIVWNVLGQFIGLFLAVVLIVWMQLGVAGALLANVVVQFVALGMAGFWLIRLARHETLHFSWITLRDMLRIGSQQYAVSLVANVLKRGETFLLAMLLNLQAVGLYAVAVGLYELIIDVPRALVWPITGKAAGREVTDKGGYILISMRLQVVVILVLVLAVALLIPPLIPLAYGEAFRASATVFMLLLPGVLFRTLHLGASSYFAAVGRPGVLFPCLVVATVTNIGLDLVMIPHLGVNGAAVATVIAEAVLAFTSVKLLLRAIGGRWVESLIVQRSDLTLVCQNVMMQLRRGGRG